MARAVAIGICRGILVGTRPMRRVVCRGRGLWVHCVTRRSDWYMLLLIVGCEGIGAIRYGKYGRVRRTGRLAMAVRWRGNRVGGIRRVRETGKGRLMLYGWTSIGCRVVGLMRIARRWRRRRLLLLLVLVLVLLLLLLLLREGRIA